MKLGNQPKPSLLVLQDLSTLLSVQVPMHLPGSALALILQLCWLQRSPQDGRCWTRREGALMAFVQVQALQVGFMAGRPPFLAQQELPCVSEIPRRPHLPASPELSSLCVRRKLMASRMMEALSRWELTLWGRGSSWANS